MDESTRWWYDRKEAFGETTGPSDKTDMISPLYWLLDGGDFNITLGDDSMHTPLLKTIDIFLGGQKFRFKIKNYFDFSNGKSLTVGLELQR